MIIKTQYENTHCSICKTFIPFGADCVWVKGTPGVTCVKPCSPPVSAPKKPRKVSGRATPTPQAENVSGGTATQAKGTPEADLLTRIPCPEAGLQAFRETCETFDLPSLLALQTMIGEAVEQCRIDVHNAAGEQPAVGPRFPRALPAPEQEPDPFHMECQRCGHIEDRKGFPQACPFCASTDLQRDKLGGVFKPIDKHVCGQWAFHDPDNVWHTRNCTSCQLTPRACIVANGVSPKPKIVTPQVDSSFTSPLGMRKPVTKPKPKFSF